MEKTRFQMETTILGILFAVGVAIIVILCVILYITHRKNTEKIKKAESEAKLEFEKQLATMPDIVQNPKITETPKREYKIKESLMTACELEYYRAIYAVLPTQYILQPQVNLATIITKIGNERYANELFRNIDFCIFNQNFKPLILIEINDASHSTEKSRIARDYKVKDICASADIPLITFWTKYGVNQEYIEKRVHETLAEISP